MSKLTRQDVACDAVMLMGPHGSGKNRHGFELCRRYPDVFGWVVSDTSRPMRRGETDGREYFFISEEQFERDIEHGEFLESTKRPTGYYGSRKMRYQAVVDKGLVPVFEHDKECLREVAAMFPRLLIVFLEVPEEQRRSRLLGDYPAMLAEELEKRLGVAAGETVWAKTETGYQIHIVDNSNGRFEEVQTEILQLSTDPNACVQNAAA